MPTRTFETGDVVRVPFPYTDRSTRQRRPALVVSVGAIGRDGNLLWIVMITSADNLGWPDDIIVEDDARTTGLPAPSIIRPSKIATIEAADADAIGQVSADRLHAVCASIRARLA